MSKKCPECGGLIPSLPLGHSADCSQNTPAQWQAHALHYYKAWRDNNLQWDGFRKRTSLEVQRWQGKVACLKHENNKLRKENDELRKQTQPTSTNPVG